MSAFDMASSNSPDLEYIVPRNISIGSDKRHLFGEGGCNEQAIKRVAVMEGHPFKDGKMDGLDGDDVNVVVISKTLKTHRSAGKIKFTLTGFNGKLPCGDNTEIYAVGIVTGPAHYVQS